MEAFIESFSAGVDAVDSFVWGWALIWLLLGTHLFMTIRTGFIQRKIPTAIKLSVSKNDPYAEGDISQFGALTTALAATIGTGNIVGVATGLLCGGPGAIFWMWITGVFGIATKYSETYISMKYRVKDANGRMIGGAMYALERGFKHKGLGKVLAVLFALFTAIASFGIGASVQSNSLAGAITSTTLVPGAADIPTWGIGLVVTALVAIVIVGGLKSVSKVCERLVPVMAIFYVVCCLVIIGMNGQYLGEAIMTIVTCAFTGQAAFGGAVGSGIMLALQYGFKRGLFSNESGLGSAPLVAASAISKNPARQALVSMSGTFWDTVIICAITGLMLVTSILGNPDLANIYNNTMLFNNDMSYDSTLGVFSGGAALATACFESIPFFGPLVLAVGLLTFTYSTMLGWSQYGDRAVTYLFGTKGIRPYQILFLVFVFWGCIGGGDLVWNCSDISNALMAVPNCIAVLGLSAVIAKETKYWVHEGRLEEEDDTEIPTVGTVDTPLEAK
ncbi:MAG: sodium:alanine symporter family protein [Coriobacteriia bacterium]|nr:sodium:alanine symporter family protein [Coriobacteriia bacterium]